MYAADGMVCTVDHLASSAGVAVLADGGTAADAAIAANAVLTVTQQHMCGLGGDLWALIHTDGDDAPSTLNASGRAGSGADPERLRAAGHRSMPNRGEVGAAPVPGCVDGWFALHEKHGRLPMTRLLGPALEIAERGFSATEQLARSARGVAEVPGNTDFAGVSTGDVIQRPGVVRVLRSIIDHGRSGFYGGEFGNALIELGGGEYTEADLQQSNADWVAPVSVDVWGHRVHTAPPNSQGYLSLAGAVIAEGLDLPTDPSDPLFGHLLIEAARAAAHDRPDVLHEHADGQALVAEARLAPRRTRIDPASAVGWRDHHADGGTIYLCVVDGDGMGVSLIQSNAQGFGSHLTVGDTGIFLHNRGIGFCLEAGHPAEYGPGRRPPHTLSPALVTTTDGHLRSVLGTMGGDAQPQVVLQMLARMLHLGESPGQIISAGRFTLASPEPGSGFDTWSDRGDVRVLLEPHASSWADGLTDRGHRVEVVDSADLSGFGHAHLIECTGASLQGAADPRAWSSAALGR